MAPHGADVGVYVRGALSGFAACRRKAKHGLRPFFPRPTQIIGALFEARLAYLIDFTTDWRAMVTKSQANGAKSRRRVVKRRRCFCRPENVTASNADCPSVMFDLPIPGWPG